MVKLIKVFCSKFNDFIVKFDDFNIVKIIKRSLLTLFPFVLLESILDWIDNSFLNPNGFYYQIFHFHLPLFFANSLHDLVIILNILISIAAAYLVGHFYIENYVKDDFIVGMTSVVAYLILNYDYRSFDNLFIFENFGLRGLVLAFITGIFVGFVFKKFVYKDTTDVSRLLINFQKLFFGVFLIVIFFILIGWSVSLVTSRGILGLLNQGLSTLILGKNTTNLLLIILLATIGQLLMFLEIYNPIVQPRMISYSTFTNVNIKFIHMHRILSGMPYPITLHTIYDAFGNIGGVGGCLALMIAILIVSNSKREKNVSYWGILPALSNSANIGFVGLPLFFNINYILPTLIVPIFNMLVGASLINLHIIPAIGYQIPITTPGILQNFVGTGGNWLSLIFSILIFTVDIFIFIPFVKKENIKYKTL